MKAIKLLQIIKNLKREKMKALLEDTPLILKEYNTYKMGAQELSALVAKAIYVQQGDVGQEGALEAAQNGYFLMDEANQAARALEYLNQSLKFDSFKKISESKALYELNGIEGLAIGIWRQSDGSVLLGVKGHGILIGLNWLLKQIKENEIQLDNQEYLELTKWYRSRGIAGLEGYLDGLRKRPWHVIDADESLSARVGSELCFGLKEGYEQQFVWPQIASLEKRSMPFKSIPGDTMGFVALTEVEALEFIRGWLTFESNIQERLGQFVLKNTVGQVFIGLEALDGIYGYLQKERYDLKVKTLEKMKEQQIQLEESQKKDWRELIALMIQKDDGLGAFDLGLASFFMLKPDLFDRLSYPSWLQIYGQLKNVAKKGEGQIEFEFNDLQEIFGGLGLQESISLSHFVNRYHRLGGAKFLAKRVVDKMIEKAKLEAYTPKTGLSIALKSKGLNLDVQGLSPEIVEASKAAANVDFSVQYGFAVALLTAQWYKEFNLKEPKALEIASKALIYSMRGASEISLECFGWFGLLLRLQNKNLNEVSIQETVMHEMSESSKIAQEISAKGGKISIENEWSGQWRTQMAQRKLNEYLQLATKLGSQNK